MPEISAHDRHMDFSVPSAFAVSRAGPEGLSRRQIDHRDLRRPFRGVRADASATDLEIVGALMDQLPERAFLLGASAAKVWGLKLPRHLDEQAFSCPTIGVSRQTPAIRRKGVTCRRVVLGRDDVVVFRGLRIASPERIWIDLSGVMTLEDFVAFTDALIGWGPWLTSIDALRAVAARFPRTQGCTESPICSRAS